MPYILIYLAGLVVVLMLMAGASIAKTMNDALFLLDKTDIARLLRVKEKTVVERRPSNPRSIR